MKTFFHSCCVLTVVAVALASPGCRRKGPASATATPQQTATNVQSAFQNAPDDLKQQAVDVVWAVQSQNPVTAYTQLEHLAERSNLTAEQQQAIFEMRMALVRQLQKDSAKGNVAAEELLNKYRSTK